MTGKNLRMSKVTRLVISGVVLAAIAGGSWFFSRDNGQNAKLGDCLHQVASDDVKIVKCDSSDADFSVVGKVEDKTQAEASGSACEPFAEAESVFWWGSSGSKGDVLCLKPLKKS
ncbi:hypothetical protein [Dactylosporangium sp. NPDC005555]|uniref:LppU/SCO3897 family protein n=1 Tax=Dactylosporangium sp. NPDC005555 TaxID=3154889 RepID=UPI0033BA23EA